MRYVKYLVVSETEANSLEQMLDKAVPGTKKDAAEFDKEVVFADGRRMAIQVIGCGEEEPAWSQGVLFSKEGNEIGCTEPCESFLGEWTVEADHTYCAVVTTPSELRQCGIWPGWYNDAVQAFRLIGELEAAGLLSAEVYEQLAEATDLPTHLLESLVDWLRGRWDYLRQVDAGTLEPKSAYELTRQTAARADWDEDMQLAAVCEFIDQCGLADQLDGYLPGRAGFSPKVVPLS